MDAPVSGLAYTCSGASGSSSNTGTTDAQGQFSYLLGQSCTLKVGKVTLGARVGVPTDGKVTPQEIGQTSGQPEQVESG